MYLIKLYLLRYLKEIHSTNSFFIIIIYIYFAINCFKLYIIKQYNTYFLFNVLFFLLTTVRYFRRYQIIVVVRFVRLLSHYKAFYFHFFVSTLHNYNM